MMTRSFCLDTIKAHCQFTDGFEELFTSASMYFLICLAHTVHEHKPCLRPTYDEYADYLDGNGFRVQGDEENGYTITCCPKY